MLSNAPLARTLQHRYEEEIHAYEGEGAWRFVFELQERLEKTRAQLEVARKELAENDEKVNK